MKNITLAFFFILGFSNGYGQKKFNVVIEVVDEKKEILPHFSAEIFTSDSALVKIQLGGDNGKTTLSLSPSFYILRISRMGFLPAWIQFELKNADIHPAPVILQHNTAALSGITISARKPFVELKPGKTIVNMEASITSVGATVLEALEKMPGITVDKDGNISLKGKSTVQIMIDGKPTYLDALQLATMLGGMNASQISQVEIMENPPARFDASGNAGVINIRTKKNKQKGFNSSISSSFGQGYYPRSNTNIQLNFRTGRWNISGNYSINKNDFFTRIYALRRYFENDGNTINRQLEQPSFLKHKGLSHHIRTGIDYSVSDRTSMGIGISTFSLNRKGIGNNKAEWMDASGITDSIILTQSNNEIEWRNAGFNFNLRHLFNSKRELTADLDVIGYRIRNYQFFENNLVMPFHFTESSRANIPNSINIISAKIDYVEQFKKMKLETGWKSSRITTDNVAGYEIKDGTIWKPDAGRSNHFLYEEYIHALYASTETKLNKWSLQGGVRYELTNYNAHQLGNSIVKDSAFSRNYNSLFPTFFASFEADSLNSFSFSAGRRIDRPAFQKLNPFLFIINKYTYQVGNPFYRPQYTWNVEMSHIFKNRLVSGISYSVTNDYFSQIFPVDSNGIVLYTEGNLEKLQNFGISTALQISPTRWWSLNSSVVLYHKKMKGFIDKAYEASITQVNLSLNNQFRFNKGWAAELSGSYSSKSQHDLQEIVDPAGQLSIGLSKTILKNRGSLRLSARDIFYTQWMKGNTLFVNVDEYFKLTRDTRVLTISFAYRFGQHFKPGKRSAGSATEEVERVGNG